MQTWVIDMHNRTLDFVGDKYFKLDPYSIDFERLIPGKDAVVSWHKHLKGKIWFTSAAEKDFLNAEQMILNLLNNENKKETA